MIKLNTKLAATAVLSAVFLAGCGGGGGGDGGGGVAGGSCPQTIAATEVVNFVQNNIIPIGENNEPLDLSCTTLATDDTIDFTPII